MNISLGCCEKSHIPYAWKSMRLIGTYLQNHLKNFSILLEYRLPCFMSIPINSVTSMSFISRWTSASCSCVMKNLLLSIVNVLDKITIFCSNRFFLSKISKLNFIKVTICKQIIRIFAPIKHSNL